MHSSLSSVAQFWQAALVGRERLVGCDVGHLLLLAVHHLHLHLLLHRSAACARQTQVGLYFQPSPPVQELLLSRVRMGKDEKTLPKALRTQASTALPSNLVWIGGFGLVGLAQ